MNATGTTYTFVNIGDGTGFHILERGFDYGVGYSTYLEAFNTLKEILKLEEKYSPPRE